MKKRVLQHRENEPPRLWFRSDRVYRCNGLWYFHTREGVDVGPYTSQHDAEAEATVLKHVLKETPTERSLRVIREFMLDSTAVGDGFDLRDAAFVDYVVDER